MFSYHRVLKTFGRSAQDTTVECNCDLHPWELWVNGEQWAGKIRLIGYVDVFFLIAYSADSRFEQGIIIYKEEDVIKTILRENEISASQIGLEPTKTDPPKLFHFSRESQYTVKSLGHEIGLKVEYPRSSIKKYEIIISKPNNMVLKRRIKRGITQHSATQLMTDATRAGFVWHGQLTGELIGRFLVGGVVEDTMGKYMENLAAGNKQGSVSLANERT